MSFDLNRNKILNCCRGLQQLLRHLHVRLVPFGIAVAGLCIACYLVYSETDRQLEKYERYNQNAAQTISKSVGYGLWSIDRSQVEALLEAFMDEPSRLEIAIYDDSGEKFSSRSGGLHVHAAPPIFTDSIVKEYSHPIEYDGRSIGWVKLRTCSVEIDQIIQRYARIVITNLLLIVLTCLALERQFRKLVSARDRALKAESAKSESLANMSHEIRTPMNGILGIAQILLDENPSPQQAEHLKLIQFSTEQLLGIINDILDFSKIESGKFSIVAEPTNIRELISRIVSLLGVKASSKGLEIVVTTDDMIPNVIEIDSTRLSQVLMNLLGNSIKFTPVDGAIIINLGVVEESDNRRMLELSIADSGVGIPKDKISNIFEPFVQADSTTAKKYGGTGLGLTLTRRLIELMGGKLNAHSREGVGSCFSFTLPMIASSSQTMPVLQPTTEASSKACEILLVEDNSVNQLIATRILEKAGHKVTVASNGELAVSIFRGRLSEIGRKPFELILMDLQMPVMDGFQATSEIKKLDSESVRTPIVALTATVQPEERQKAFDLGMCDFVIKPFKVQQLLDVVAARRVMR